MKKNDKPLLTLQNDWESTNELTEEIHFEKLHKSKCSGCNIETSKLFQNNLCKSCLSQTFKRLVKVIDSVRNV
jgi:rRNA maturation endonuclease Nob1